MKLDPSSWSHDTARMMQDRAKQDLQRIEQELSDAEQAVSLTERRLIKAKRSFVWRLLFDRKAARQELDSSRVAHENARQHLTIVFRRRLKAQIYLNLMSAQLDAESQDEEQLAYEAAARKRQQWLIR